MPYRFAIKRQDYSDYASGRVFYGLSGHPAFPVRLASEILQRCMAVHHKEGRVGPYVLYDPCCGRAYLLSTLAYLHGPDIAGVIGSDVDPRALEVAARNLELLTPAGLEQRKAEIRQMWKAYGKVSHQEALQSAQCLGERLQAMLADRPTHTRLCQTRLFQADALDGNALSGHLAGVTLDVVITDIPYGRDSDWQPQNSPENAAAPAPGPAGQKTAPGPVGRMLEALLAVVSPWTVVAIAAHKGPRLTHEGYRRIERFRLGKRQVALLMPAHMAQTPGHT
jgi:hypothetical protein